ncbi:protein bunched, class 2/F/G isoform-like [Bacillus rossius redtenbacheri]|uniref:protein bunched, class 2/F/G isoform-like n=1 Tax=Bacillus rossius redtenbacheri TaxID=93214 RepID=UPI002FDD250E
MKLLTAHLESDCTYAVCLLAVAHPLGRCVSADVVLSLLGQQQQFHGSSISSTYAVCLLAVAHPLGRCVSADVVLSLLGQQQQFHAFAFGQRPFLSGHFGNPLDPLQRAADPLGGSLSFRMPAMSNCQNVTCWEMPGCSDAAMRRCGDAAMLDAGTRKEGPPEGMGQFGLGATNNHWGYSAASPYSSYLAPGTLGSCAAPGAGLQGGGFNTPALGFSTAATTADLNGQGTATAHDAFGTSSVPSILPDNTVSSGVASELDQHLGGLVTQHAASTTGHHHQASNNHSGAHPQERGGSSGSAASAGLLVPRYPTSVSADFAALAGPRSLSDSSAGESPVGSEDILPSGGGGQLGATNAAAAAASNSFSSLVSGHHNQASAASYASSSSNLYLGAPVLPASLLYSQLYSAASSHQNHHQFHHLHHHHHHNSAAGQDLHSAMETNHGQLQRSMVSDLLGGSCANLPARGGALSASDDEQHTQRLGNSVQQRVHTTTDNTAVWRPY